MGEKPEPNASEKAETAFNVLDGYHDGYISEAVMIKVSQINAMEQKCFSSQLFSDVPLKP